MITARELKLLVSLKEKKYRKKYGKFLIEGFHLIEECLDSSYNLERIILRNDMDLSLYPEILPKISASDVKIDALEPGLFSRISDTENSQGIIGVVSMKRSPEDFSGRIILALDGISDPGNLGTILRMAYWFGVKSVLAGKGSADIYNPKVVRSTQGAIFHLNVHNNSILTDDLKLLKQSGYTVFLFDVNSGDYLDRISKSEKSVLVFGSESSGISEGLFSEGFNTVKIRGFSECESLNAAISCGIALYEFTK